jgi:hypothetical protein
MSVRFLTNDGQFGLLISPATEQDMFRFQLIVDGHVIGDTEPCFLVTAMRGLGGLRRQDDTRLATLSSDPTLTLSTLLDDEDLHDATTLPLAESLDQWLIHGYVYRDDAVVIARAAHGDSVVDPTWISIVEFSEYSQVVEAARDYWSKAIRSHPDV